MQILIILDKGLKYPWIWSSLGGSNPYRKLLHAERSGYPDQGYTGRYHALSLRQFLNVEQLISPWFHWPKWVHMEKALFSHDRQHLCMLSLHSSQNTSTGTYSPKYAHSMPITACLQLHPVRITVASDWEHRFQMFPQTRNRNKKHRKWKPVTLSSETMLIWPEVSSPGTRFCHSRALPFTPRGSFQISFHTNMQKAIQPCAFLQRSRWTTEYQTN